MSKKDANEMRIFSKNVEKTLESQRKNEKDKYIQKAFEYIYKNMEEYVSRHGGSIYTVKFICPVHSDPEKIERLFVSEDETIDVPVADVGKEFEKLGYLVSLKRHKDNWYEEMKISF